MFSFYGGQQGKDFNIKEIFKNKVSLQEDLNRRWQSPIAVGEIVLISYGLPSGIHDKENWVYDDNKQVDLDAYGKSYNSTLWQKIYTENASNQKDDLQGIEVIYVSEDYGLGYKLLTSLTGETPKVRILNSDEMILDADERPYIEVNKNDSDYPELSFYLPQSQVILEENVSTTVINPGIEPTVEFDNEGEKINRPTINFNLPKAWNVELGVITPLNANANPSVLMTTGEDTKTLSFAIPQSQVILEENVSTTVLKPGVEPSIDFNNETNINRPTINFNLPKAWGIELGNISYLPADAEPSVEIRDDEVTKFLDFKLPQGYVFNDLVLDNSDPGSTPEARLEYDDDKILTLYLTLPRTQKLNTELIINHVGPLTEPSVSLSDDVDSPQFTFNLPDAVEFYFGDLLGKSVDVTYVLDTLIDGALVGDYYINKSTGFIYLITEINNESQTTTFEYKACLAGAEPVVKTEFIDTFDSENNPNPISINTTYEDDVEKTGVQHTFYIPNPPAINATYNKVGILDEGGVTKEIPDANAINFIFDIPSGSKWYVGDQINDTKLNTVIDDAKNGDYYLYVVDNQDDIYRGNIYIYENNAWKFTGRNIEGPVGKALNVVASYDLTGSAVNNTVDYVGSLLQSTQYFGRVLASDELIAVNYTETDDNVQKSYWYYYIDGKWNRTLLTGGFGGLIENIWIADDTNKVYSVQYINSLITNDTNSTSNLNTFSANAINTLIAASETKNKEYITNLIKNTYDTDQKNVYNVEYINSLIAAEVSENDKVRKTYNAQYLDSKFEEIGTDISERVSNVEEQIIQIKEDVLTDVEERLGTTEKEIEDLATSVSEDFKAIEQSIQDLEKDVDASLVEIEKTINDNVKKDIEDLKESMSWGKISDLIIREV